MVIESQNDLMLASIFARGLFHTQCWCFEFFLWIFIKDTVLNKNLSIDFHRIEPFDNNNINKLCLNFNNSNLFLWKQFPIYYSNKFNWNYCLLNIYLCYTHTHIQQHHHHLHSDHTVSPDEQTIDHTIKKRQQMSVI